jgi:hypothetical protein
MRWRLNRAPNFVLSLIVFAWMGAFCALGQQPSPAAQKPPVAAAQTGVSSSAAPTGKQAAKDVVPDPPPNPSTDPMATESAQLLKLATELKTEINKTNQNVLSIAVIRKADEIERMAHGMKDKVRVQAAQNDSGQGKEEP